MPGRSTVTRARARTLPLVPAATGLPVEVVNRSSVESGVADLAFLQAIIRLAETLHLVTIAEGIETPTQLDQLKSTACAYGQGYFLARPGAIVDIPAVLPAISSAPPLGS